jgi:hypothetical protein
MRFNLIRYCSRYHSAWSRGSIVPQLRFYSTLTKIRKAAQTPEAVPPKYESVATAYKRLRSFTVKSGELRPGERWKRPLSAAP